MPQYLRPEARPVDWLALDSAQREVFRQVVQMIAEAIEALPEPDLTAHSATRGSELAESG